MRLLNGLAMVLLLAGCAAAPPVIDTTPETAVAGVGQPHLTADYWIRRQPNSDKLLLDAAAIDAHNAELLDAPSFHGIEYFSGNLRGEQVREWIGKLSQRPARRLYDERGQEVVPAQLDELIRQLNLKQVPDAQHTRYGMVAQRADLRTFPTRLRVFSAPDETDIDRFQESALFPGTPVVIAHASEDGEWLFVVSPLYAAWIEKRYVAAGPAPQIFEYWRKTPYLVVTGATVLTAFTPERREISQLQLDMGVRVPVLADWPANKPVNGQHPYTAHVIELPTRGSDGELRFVPALLPKTADVAAGYLPLTYANLLKQAFKFLGERYGWGHSYNARDCSGFVSEIYRSFGVQMPRNTGDQGVSPAPNRISFTEQDGHEKRLAALHKVQVGDLIYIPGHVMMVIGFDRGMPYVIHDTAGVSFRNGDAIDRVQLNGVSVTPLLPLLLDDGQPLIDRIYSIQRIAARKNRPESN